MYFNPLLKVIFIEKQKNKVWKCKFFFLKAKPKTFFIGTVQEYIYQLVYNAGDFLWVSFSRVLTVVER